MANGFNLETNKKKETEDREDLTTHTNTKNPTWKKNNNVTTEQNPKPTKNQICSNQHTKVLNFEKQTSTCWCDPLEINSK